MSTVTTDPTPATPAVPVPVGTGTSSSLFEAVSRRIRSGELGAWPVLIGLIVIWVVFQSFNDRFLSSQNLYNIAVQTVPFGVLSVGVVLVLLLGEIDLSIGSVTGVGAALLTVLAVRHGLPDWSAMLLVLAAGVLIGTIHGFVFARIGVPAFVVTLAGNIGWMGLQLWLLAPQGTINVDDKSFIASLMFQNLDRPVAWVVGVVVVALYAAAVVVDGRRRAAAGLANRSLVSHLVRIIGLAAVIAATVGMLNTDRGVPVGLLIFVVLVAVTDLMLRRTRYGRRIFAVGGNVEAARRAGINVVLIRISVFALASTFAAFGGILFASRNLAASQSTGSADTLLIAIAAAVIGGVSLFGGRGSPYGALLGSLVLGSISAGMNLLSLESSIKFMITAGVLLAAVVVDSLSRRGRRSHGRE